MYKISEKVIKLIEDTIRNWKEELTARGESFAAGKIQRGIFQRDALSLFLFVIAMIPLNHKLKNLTKSQEKINHLMYMDGIKLFAKNEKELQTLIQTIRIYSQDIGMEFGIEKCATLIIRGKRQMREGIELPNQEKSERSEKRKSTKTWEYWKRTL